MKARFAVLAALVAGFLVLGTGCSNKATAERNSLLSQNDDLKRQLDAEKAAHAAAEARANAATAQVATLPPPAPAPTENVRTPSMEPGPLDLSGGGKLPDLGSGITTSRNTAGEVTIAIPGDVLFDSGKAALKPSAKKTLDTVAAAIKKQYGSQTLRIEGHTDPTPVKSSGWDDNWDLGAARARAVLLYLESKGVAQKNMYIASFGANDLKSTKNLALDRRVDIVVVKNAK